MNEFPSHDPSTPADNTTPDVPAPTAGAAHFTAARDNKGRFMKGNPGGPGNPFARQVAMLRSVLVNTVRPEDMKRIAQDLVVQAKFGNMEALKLLFLYVLGKPAQAVNPDTLDIEEWRQIFQPIPQIMREVPETLMALSAEKACDMAQATQPAAHRALKNALKMPTEQFEQMTAESKTEQPEQPQTGAEPAPSPSPNGGSRRPRPLPPWLLKIAARMRLAKPRGKRRRGK